MYHEPWGVCSRSSRNINVLKYRYIPNAAIQGRRHVLTSQGASLSDAQLTATQMLQVGADCPQDSRDELLPGFEHVKATGLGMTGRVRVHAR